MVWDGFALREKQLDYSHSCRKTSQRNFSRGAEVSSFGCDATLAADAKSAE